MSVVKSIVKPRSCCIDLPIAQSIQQDLGLIFSHAALVVSHRWFEQVVDWAKNFHVTTNDHIFA